MTSFAEIKNNKVVRVIVATKEVIDKNYSGNWIETFIETDYTLNPRKNYTGIGYSVDNDNDFVPPPPTIANAGHEVYLKPDSKRYIIRDKITKKEITME